VRLLILFTLFFDFDFAELAFVFLALSLRFSHRLVTHVPQVFACVLSLQLLR